MKRNFSSARKLFSDGIDKQLHQSCTEKRSPWWNERFEAFSRTVNTSGNLRDTKSATSLAELFKSAQYSSPAKEEDICDESPSKSIIPPVRKRRKCVSMPCQKVELEDDIRIETSQSPVISRRPQLVAESSSRSCDIIRKEPIRLSPDITTLSTTSSDSELDDDAGDAHCSLERGYARGSLNGSDTDIQISPVILSCSGSADPGGSIVISTTSESQSSELLSAAPPTSHRYHSSPVVKESGKKRSKFIIGGFASKLQKLLQRERTENAIWRRKCNTNSSTSTDGVIEFTVSALHTAGGMTIADCKLLRSYRCDGLTAVDPQLSFRVLLLNNQHHLSPVGVGTTFQVHPPWQLLHVNHDTAVILCTRFLRILEIGRHVAQDLSITHPRKELLAVWNY